MRFRKIALLAGAFVIASGAPIAVMSQPAPEEHLVLVPSGQLQRLYLATGADLSHVTGVIIDPVQVAFRDNWMRDFNNSTRSGRLTQQRADQIAKEVSTGMDTLFVTAFRNGGLRILQDPGPNVVRIQTHVINLALTAPTVARSARSRTWAANAGEATLVMEVRDSRTNALLGRALDRRIAGGTLQTMRNSVTNRSDFRRMFESWASTSVEDFRALQKAAAPKAAAH